MNLVKQHYSALFFVAVIASVLATLVYFEGQRKPTFDLNAPLPISLDQSYNSYDFVISGTPTFTRKAKLVITSNGPFGIQLGSIPYFLDYDTQEKTYACEAFEFEKLKCQIPLIIGGQDLSAKIFSVPQQPNVEISDFRIATLYKKHNTTLDAEKLKTIIFLLLPFLILIYFLHHNRAASQWALVAAATAILLYNHALFTIFLGCFLTFLFLTRHILEKQSRYKLTRLSIIIFITITFLIVFKYGQEAVFRVFANPGDFDFLMPLGISYFTIRLIDTILKWYRGTLLNVSFREFICFIIFPGTLIAGPIETLDNFQKNRLEKICLDDLKYGIFRTTLGIFKKLVLADVLLGLYLNDLQNGAFYSVALFPETVEHSYILKYTLFYFLFAYLDFSAYSDIAIGLSRIMGYKISENFNMPLIARNISEYWQRWHMTLSNWCMRNVFFPVMLKTKNPYIPIYVTMLVVGLWHAPNLSWFSWAIHHSSGLMFLAILKKYFTWHPKIEPMIWPLRSAVTILFVMGGFCFVSVSDYDTALTLYSRFWLEFFT